MTNEETTGPSLGNESEQSAGKPAYDGPLEIRAYNVKTKEKNVLMLDPVLKKTAKGAYQASGHDEKGQKLSALLGAANAEALIAAGVAKLAED